MAGQLPLDLALPPRWGRDDFLPAPANAAALAAVERWPDWPDPVLVMCGPPGAGKTHLAAIWAGEAGALRLPAEAVSDATWQAATATAGGTAIAIEDADRGIGSEAALFHLLNVARERRLSVLLTAREPPDRWGLRTPDLLSRLRLAGLVSLEAPDEALLSAVLVKLFADRQMVVEGSVVSYLTLRLARSLDEARRVVAALDHATLAQRRRVTRPLAAEVLQALGLDGGAP